MAMDLFVHDQEQHIPKYRGSLRVGPWRLSAARERPWTSMEELLSSDQSDLQDAVLSSMFLDVKRHDSEDHARREVLQSQDGCHI
jgi:hypothetical protein